ncbi:hypothetical protein GCM10025868_26720 [Angustibacter aerolatus]|uniref:Secreted protein n=1 Tax=Angustibacter aerolatus TaxID=1162965 RepID=A0ABQ6JKN9_9ACTN|nr:hypothetical protein GCM10025868_26720 [Angustibacter aerolatus]
MRPVKVLLLMARSASSRAIASQMVWSRLSWAGWEGSSMMRAAVVVIVSRRRRAVVPGGKASGAACSRALVAVAVRLHRVQDQAQTGQGG